MDSPTPASTPLPEPIVAPSSSRNFPESPLRISLRAARTNFVPGLCVQVLMLAVVLAYYRAAWARPWFDQLGELKQDGGYLFTVVAAIIGAALLPEVFKLVWLERRLPVGRDAVEVYLRCVFGRSTRCASTGSTVAERLVRSGRIACGRCKKGRRGPVRLHAVLRDAFAVVCFVWKNSGYSVFCFSRSIYSRYTGPENHFRPSWRTGWCGFPW